VSVQINLADLAEPATKLDISAALASDAPVFVWEQTLAAQICSDLASPRYDCLFRGIHAMLSVSLDAANSDLDIPTDNKMIKARAEATHRRRSSMLTHGKKQRSVERR
jgi:hypothetical protein